MGENEIDAIFEGLIAGAGLESPARDRMIKRSGDKFVITLPPVVRQNILELCGVAAAVASGSQAPVLYEEEHDQVAYSLLSGDALAKQALADCRNVALVVMEDEWQEDALLSLVRVTNSLRIAFTSSVESPEDLRHLRAANPEVAQLLDFLGALQQEALDALM